MTYRTMILAAAITALLSFATTKAEAFNNGVIAGMEIFNPDPPPPPSRRLPADITGVSVSYSADPTERSSHQAKPSAKKRRK